MAELTFEQLFSDLENNKPFAKIALEGFAGDGKSWTAVSLAIGIHQLVGSKKPIALLDTEKALDKQKSRFTDMGIKAVSTQGRSLSTVTQAIAMCNAGHADILIIDSITHIWENYLQAYMNEKKRTRLEFQDWGVIKPKWKKEFSDVFVNANCHIIFTGRAGYEYETEVIKEDGKKDRKEIHKSGIKMKAENETAFEPDMLILMEKKQDLLGDKKEIYREATVIKDRTNMVDGKTFKNPTFDDFYPAISVMIDGTLREIHGVDLPDTFQDFESKFSDIGKRRERAISEIEGSFNLIGLGTSAEHKKAKAAILNNVFGKTSIDGIYNIGIDKIEHGENIVKSFASKYIEYCDFCKESGTTPEVTKMGELLKEEIAEWNLF